MFKKRYQFYYPEDFPQNVSVFASKWAALVLLLT